MYRHLVRTIRAKFAPLLAQPFEVGELFQTILPYRLHRRELGLETNQDYELVMLSLLAGTRGYLVVDDKMRDVLAASLASPNPDPSIIKNFASSHVALAPETLHRLDAEGRASGTQGAVGATPARASSPGPHRTASGSMPATGSTPGAGNGVSTEPSQRRTMRPMTVTTGEHCAFCKGELPTGRQISFCPHCGQDLTIIHCPACGSELERDWKFCATCGRTAGD
jgi:predicted RNA-binding Zn-ribbon protein involved in translation (DUF1610 family)